MNFQNTFLELTAGRLDQLPQSSVPQIALSGRSNVGKSSLINCLIGRKSLARVSSAPGKTITINYYNIDKKLYLVDLPGYGYAKRSEKDRRVWSALTDSYFTEYIESINFLSVIQLVDLRTGATDDDMMMLSWMAENHIPYFIVATKSDKLNKTERAKSIEKLREDTADAETIIFSSLKGEGKDDLRKKISALCK